MTAGRRPPPQDGARAPSIAFSVTDKGDGSEVTWTEGFEPVGEEAVAKEVIAGIFRSGLEALQAKL